MNRPLSTGEYAVGTFTHSLYNLRDEALETKSRRSLALRIYYPVLKEDIEGMEKTEYMSRDMAKALSKTVHVPINYDKSTKAGDNISDCYKDAPKIRGSRFPLIIFNHGLMSYRESNSFLCIELASHGYVVMSISHPMDSCLTEFDDGTSVPFFKTLAKKQYEPFLGGALSVLKLSKAKGVSERELSDRFDEIQRKYCKLIMSRIPEWDRDNLAALDYAKNELSDLIDFDPGIGITGHSLGGTTAYSLCLNYPEFKCGINMDGALFGDHTGKVLNKPFIQMCCSTNKNAETRSLIDHRSIVYLVEFNDMTHLGFTDIKQFMNIPFLAGRLEPFKAHDNICKCHLELFDTYLKGTKDKPVLISNDAVTIKEYEPDIRS